jgi:hypothetical protein
MKKSDSRHVVHLERLVLHNDRMVNRDIVLRQDGAFSAMENDAGRLHFPPALLRLQLGKRLREFRRAFDTHPSVVSHHLLERVIGHPQLHIESKRFSNRVACFLRIFLEPRFRSGMRMLCLRPNFCSSGS